ncbi:MAG: hypothetical protein OHK0039_33870 [Bacteroidia bacterium]
MEKGLLILALSSVFAFSTVCAQNDLFFDFMLTYAQVEQQLGRWDRVRHIEKKAGEYLCIEFNETRFRYDFFGGRLYQITMTRSFAQLKEARRAHTSIMAYFDRIAARPLAGQKQAVFQPYICYHDMHLYNLHLRQLSRSDIVLEMRDRFSIYTPLYTWDAYDPIATQHILTDKQR